MSIADHGPAAADGPAISPASTRTVTDIEDVLVFEHHGASFGLVGGRGRGAGWAGQVQVKSAERSLVDRAWRVGHTLHQEGPEPRHVVGPYYARNAAAVPVGNRHVVVFGSAQEITMLDSDLLRAAAGAVDSASGVPAEKLLADELEVVDAVRKLMAYRPTTVRDTARHVAAVTARALACEVAAISIEHDGKAVVEGVGFGVDGPVPGAQAGSMLGRAALTDLPHVEQSSTDGVDLFGIDVASRMTLPITSGPSIGALAVGHSRERPRGFTALCQRIGRAIAESADELLAQAAAREDLDAQLHRLARTSGTDALTGIANRRSWDEAVAALSANDLLGPTAVVSADVEGLKAVNDLRGHQTGDAVLVAVARMLTTSVREQDLVARVGGDEFALLLRGATLASARAVTRRIRRAERGAGVPGTQLPVRVSLGVAEVGPDGVEAARAVADRRMYANKRRRRQASGRP